MKIGMDASNLSSSLRGNPTLSTLESVARVLNVEVYDLFEHRKLGGVYGFVEVGDEVYKIADAEDWVKVSSKIASLAEPRLFVNLEEMRQAVSEFVIQAIAARSSSAMMGRLLNVELFCLTFDPANKIFQLVKSTEGLYTFDVCEYGGEEDIDLDGDEGLLSGILNTIESALEQQ